ncbi:hypothetical protein JTB14_015413 [Gonioctena quinquepunctata]|nr:hypothetical protein JTB14_015413 [Gonioctena quinquepunctata]
MGKRLSTEKNIAKWAEKGSSASMPIKPTFIQVTGDVRIDIPPNTIKEVFLAMEQMEPVRETVLDGKQKD